jgi:hypothetical protein
MGGEEALVPLGSAVLLPSVAMKERCDLKTGIPNMITWTKVTNTQQGRHYLYAFLPQSRYKMVTQLC